MSVPFLSVTALRIIQESETDADSPDSEELLSQIRENWEVSLILNFYTGDSGTATENPTETILTDDGAAYDADEHNGRSLVMIDGLAAGNIYTIDDTTATTLTCTGDTLLADGVLSGDAYKIFYNLKNTVAHNHNGVNSSRSNLCLIHTGTYTGDGTEGQGITGVGFRPKFVWIFEHPAGGAAETHWLKLDQTWGDYAFPPNAVQSVLSLINSLDADGFTVDDFGGDSNPNADGVTYDYIALG